MIKSLTCPLFFCGYKKTTKSLKSKGHWVYSICSMSYIDGIAKKTDHLGESGNTGWNEFKTMIQFPVHGY